MASFQVKDTNKITDMDIDSVKIEKIEKMDSVIAFVTGVKDVQDESTTHVDLVS